MDAEAIAEEARKSISAFCIEECKSYCCRNGYLVLTEQEAELVANTKASNLIHKNIVKNAPEGKYSILMEPDKPCLSLRDYKCKMYTHPRRPLVCKKFPIFIEGNKIRLSTRCLAVKTGLLYPYIKELLMLRYELSESCQIDDDDIYITPIPKPGS